MSTPTRASVRHLVANKIAIISGNAQLLANDPEADIKIKHKAKIIDREAHALLEGILALFKDENADLGRG